MNTILQKLAELTKEIVALEAKQKAESKQVQLMPLTVKEVLPGDVWYLPKNEDLAHNPLYTVKSVNKRKNRVEFTEGWNPLDNMLSGEWVLLSRKLTARLEAKVRKRSMDRVAAVPKEIT